MEQGACPYFSEIAQHQLFVTHLTGQDMGSYFVCFFGVFLQKVAENIDY